MKDTFDSIFKLLVLVMLGYFLFLVNKTSSNKEAIIEIGRYQFHSTDNFVLDTKTGTVYKPYIGKLPTE